MAAHIRRSAGADGMGILQRKSQRFDSTSALTSILLQNSLLIWF